MAILLTILHQHTPVMADYLPTRADQAHLATFGRFRLLPSPFGHFCPLLTTVRPFLALLATFAVSTDFGLLAYGHFWFLARLPQIHFWIGIQKSNPNWPLLADFG